MVVEADAVRVLRLLAGDEALLEFLRRSAAVRVSFGLIESKSLVAGDDVLTRVLGLYL